MAAPHAEFFTPNQASSMRDILKNINGKVPGLTTMGILEESMGNFLAQHDRFHASSYLPQMIEQVGNVFITRPKLNFSSPNLSYDRILSTLNSLNSNSSAFMIRCLLDTHFATQPEHMNRIDQSPLINNQSPFLIPLCNGIVGISGWPDIVLETESTEGGYFSENQTYVTGSDRLYRTYNFNLTFKDVPSSPIFNIIFYWLQYMAAVTLGDISAYNFHIDGLRLDYTVSIYQFIMDPTRRYILNWAKATGCFPISLPIGDIFNFSEGSFLTEGSGKFSIPFVVNNVKYKDYLRILDFNMLAQRYCKNIEDAPVIKHNSPYNYVGLPFIVSTPKGFIMTYRDVHRQLPAEEIESLGSSSESSSYTVPSYKAYTEGNTPVMDSQDISLTGFNFDLEAYRGTQNNSNISPLTAV